MTSIQSFLLKAIRLGPLPYLVLAVAIIGAGVLLQMRFTTTDNLASGRSIFGLMAQIGGSVGLFGLLTIAFQTRGASASADPVEATPVRPGAATDLPDSAWDARIEAVKSRLKASPSDAQGASAASVDTTRVSARPRTERPRANAAAARMPQLDAGQIGKLGMRMARQTGTRLLSQMLKRGS